MLLNSLGGFMVGVLVVLGLRGTFNRVAVWVNLLAVGMVGALVVAGLLGSFS